MNSANRLQNTCHAGAIHQLSKEILSFFSADEVDSPDPHFFFDLHSEHTSLVSPLCTVDIHMRAFCDCCIPLSPRPFISAFLHHLVPIEKIRGLITKDTQPPCPLHAARSRRAPCAPLPRSMAEPPERTDARLKRTATPP